MKALFLSGLFLISLGFAIFWITPSWGATNLNPIAYAQSLVTNEDTSLHITLTGTDPEGASLTYAISNNPTKGSLACTGPNCIYSPASNVNGNDFFYFKVNDGSLYSRPARVTITINAVNDSPTVTSAAYSYNEDYTATIFPQKSDVERDALTLQVLTQPLLGQVTVSGDALIFTPAANAYGQDSFTFTASDGKASSAPGTISLTINPVNDAPTIQNQNVTTNEDVSIAINLSASDVDEDALTAIVGYASGHGTVSLNGTVATYTPNPNYYGDDSFTYRAYDGTAYSNDTATVTIVVNGVNDPPTVEDAFLEVSEGKSAIVTLTGTDVEGLALSFSIAEAPDHGTASITGNTLTYSADQGFVGEDSLLFVASDGETQSAPGTVSMTVLSSNAVVPIDINDLEPIPGVTTTVSSDKNVIQMASDGCYQFISTPLILPLKLDDEQMTEAVVGTLHSVCGGYRDVENYNFFVRTDNGAAYRMISERELGLEPDAQATAFFDPSSGTLVTPLNNTAFNSEDPNEPTGGLMIQKEGGTEYINPFMGRPTDASVIMVDGVIALSTTNFYTPTCENGGKIDAENCGVWGIVDPDRGELIDSSIGNDYETSYSAGMTRVIVKNQNGEVSYDRLTWGTGPGGNIGDASDTGGACSSYLVDKENFINSAFEGGLVNFDFFADDLTLGAKSFDPGDPGCANPNTNGSILRTDAIQGEVTVGFDPERMKPTYWIKGYMPDVSGSSYTRISELDENFDLFCDVMINSGANKNPFNGGTNGMVVAFDGTVFTNASYYDSQGIPRTSLLAIDPVDCSNTTLVELNMATTEWLSFSGVTLGADAEGNDVILAAVAGDLYVHTLNTNETTTYPLGSASSDKIMASPVIDGAGRVIVMSAGNVMTIFNDMGFSYGDHPWPRFRKNNFGSATAEIIEMN